MERNIILSVMRLRRLEMNISLINNVARQDALLISKNLLNGHNQIYETERNLAHKIQSSNPTIEGLIYLAIPGIQDGGNKNGTGPKSVYSTYGHRMLKLF